MQRRSHAASQRIAAAPRPRRRPPETAAPTRPSQTSLPVRFAPPRRDRGRTHRTLREGRSAPRGAGRRPARQALESVPAAPAHDGISPAPHACRRRKFPEPASEFRRTAPRTLRRRRRGPPPACRRYRAAPAPHPSAGSPPHRPQDRARRDSGRTYPADRAGAGARPGHRKAAAPPCAVRTHIRRPVRNETKREPVARPPARWPAPCRMACMQNRSANSTPPNRSR